MNAQVSDAFRKNTALLENALQEAFGPMRDRESLVLLAAQVERIRHAVETLEFAVQNGAPETYVRRFDAELEQLHTGIAAAFGSLANSLRASKPDPRWPELTAAISALDKKAALVRPAIHWTRFCVSTRC